MNGPSPSAVRAAKVAAVSSGLPQYPAVTEPPDCQISPTCPSGSTRSDSGSTMTTDCPMLVRPQPTSTRRRSGLLHRPVLAQLLRIDRQRDHRRLRASTGHEQRALGEPVAGIEGLGTESVRRELAGEGLHDVRLHRLGAVEGDSPRGEVDALDVFRGDPVHAELVGEVRPATGRRPKLGDRVQPDRRRSRGRSSGDKSTDMIPRKSGWKTFPMRPMSW